MIKRYTISVMLFIYMCSKKYLTLPYSDVVISVSVVITVMGSFFMLKV